MTTLLAKLRALRQELSSILLEREIAIEAALLALLTRFSTPEELFGPLSLAALEHDQHRRISTGTSVEAHVAFPDEVWTSNSAILNSLLGAVRVRGL